MALKLEIVTPEKEAYSDQVDSVVIPGADGQVGVLPAHAPLVTTLVPGELVFEKGGESHHIAVGEGFVEVSNDTVSVMADIAMSEADIDEEAVEKALKRAQDALEGITHEDEENFAALQATIAKSLAQLHVKRRRRRL